jgi:hypothetical protein
MQLTFAAQTAPRNHRFDDVSNKIDIVPSAQKESGHVSVAVLKNGLG